jgi:hypothetical protein
MTLHLPLEDEERPGDKGHTYTDNSYLYISLTVHHDINQFVIANLMHIYFIS